MKNFSKKNRGKFHNLRLKSKFAGRLLDCANDIVACRKLHDELQAKINFDFKQVGLLNEERLQRERIFRMITSLSKLII